MSNDSQIYEDAFTITQVQDQTYERVARISATTDTNDTQLTLDINNELYPLEVSQQIRMVIATTLNVDGTKEEAGWRAKSADEGLAQYYEYVCYGKVYKHHDPGDGANIKVYVSFGGLLMLLDGPYRKLSPLRQDYVYMLMKKN